MHENISLKEAINIDNQNPYMYLYDDYIDRENERLHR